MRQCKQRLPRLELQKIEESHRCILEFEHLEAIRLERPARGLKLRFACWLGQDLESDELKISLQYLMTEQGAPAAAEVVESERPNLLISSSGVRCGRMLLGRSIA